jgi:Fe2+ or Zn2+ uptake regulation protein
VSPDYQEISSLVIELTEYFETHPNAADSLEGITKWWIKKKDPASSQASVLSALEYLCAEGIVVKTSGPAGNAIYSLAKH